MIKIYKSVCDKPLFKEYSKIWMSDFVHPSGRKTGLVNTNRLIRTYDGIDGGKTGYTNKARFCLTASATRGETRLVGVVIGSDDSKTRFSEMSSLFNYGFSNFESKLLIDKEVPVTLQNFKNAKAPISIYPEDDVNMFFNKNEEFVYSTGFEIYELKAPISQGDVV
jgi:D-alanyl-D-alanine carboxypeptidase (penicillin-binding protein 5/6)